MPSHRLTYIKLDKEFTVMGYSVAGEESVIAVPELDVCFDIGKAPEQVIPINNVLLTHGHIDHASGIAYYLSHRQFCGQAAGRVFVPEGLVEPVQEILDAWGRLDGNEVPCELFGVKAGDEYRIKPNIFMRVFDTVHNRNSVGYTVIELRKKLKEEYVGMSGSKLVELKKKGVEIDRRIEIPLVTYLGDTAAVGDYAELDYVRQSRVLITECTFFLDEHKDRARAGRHTHVDDLAGFLEPMENKYIVLTHFTQRTHIREAKRLIRSKLPKELVKKITLLMDNH